MMPSNYSSNEMPFMNRIEFEMLGFAVVKLFLPMLALLIHVVEFFSFDFLMLVPSHSCQGLASAKGSPYTGTCETDILMAMC